HRMQRSAARNLDDAERHPGTTSAPAGPEDGRGKVPLDPAMGDQVIQHCRPPRLLRLAPECADLLVEVALREGLPRSPPLAGQPVEDLAGILLDLLITRGEERGPQGIFP